MSRTHWLRAAFERISTPLPERACQIMIIASAGILAINIVAGRTPWLYPIAVALFWLGVIELRMPRDHGDKTKQR